MILLRLIQKLIATLNSEGTPGQVAAGMTLGAALGLTPLLNVHNLLVVGVIFVFNVSVPAATLGWLVFAPVGFLLDPWFDTLGAALLVDAGGLAPVWTWLYNLPVIPLSNYNNTVVLGSLIGWLVLALPIFFGARLGVAGYRTHLLPRIQKLEVVRMMKASKVYNLYRLFRPE